MLSPRPVKSALEKTLFEIKSAAALLRYFQVQVITTHAIQYLVPSFSWSHYLSNNSTFGLELF